MNETKWRIADLDPIRDPVARLETSPVEGDIREYHFMGFTKRNISMLAIGAVGALGCIAHAATITAGGDLLNQSSVPPPGSQGYFFYPSGPSSVPSQYSIAQAGGTQLSAGDTSYAMITISGVSYRTGVLYNPGTGANKTATLATITLAGTSGDSVPNFTLGVLEDNAGDGSYNSQASITVASGVSSVTTSVAGNSTPQDDFYFFNVTNATVGDTITVATTVAPDGGQALIGGLTFDTTSPATPEPATIGLLGLGALGLLRRKRRA